MNRRKSRKNSGPKSADTGGPVDRREFLASVTGLASAALLAKGAEASGSPVSTPGKLAPASGPLAIDGGTPVLAEGDRS